jgi:hypothetical protein
MTLGERLNSVVSFSLCLSLVTLTPSIVTLRSSRDLFHVIGMSGGEHERSELKKTNGVHEGIFVTAGSLHSRDCRQSSSPSLTSFSFHLLCLGHWP